MCFLNNLGRKTTIDWIQKPKASIAFLGLLLSQIREKSLLFSNDSADHQTNVHRNRKYALGNECNQPRLIFSEVTQNIKRGGHFMFRKTTLPRGIMEESREVIAYNMIEFREKNNLSREEMAELCDLSSRHIENIEFGKIAVTVDTLDKISYGTLLSAAYWLTNHQ